METLQDLADWLEENVDTYDTEEERRADYEIDRLKDEPLEFED